MCRGHVAELHTNRLVTAMSVSEALVCVFNTAKNSELDITRKTVSTLEANVLFP